jgi:hypothetical protein
VNNELGGYSVVDQCLVIESIALPYLALRKWISKVLVGIHALTNGHEYHCVAIRMRCWLMDACLYSLLQC